MTPRQKIVGRLREASKIGSGLSVASKVMVHCPTGLVRDTGMMLPDLLRAAEAISLETHSAAADVLERVAAASQADPTSDDLSVELALRLADAEATIARRDARIAELETANERRAYYNNDPESAQADERLYQEAVAAVRESGRASVSYVQRVLRLNYNHGLALVQRMEREGVVSAADLAGKRSVLGVQGLLTRLSSGVLGVEGGVMGERVVVNVPVLQEWVQRISFMQQTVLLTAIRGPDGLPKYGPAKLLLRWFRRCVLLSAMDGKVLHTPWDNNGGSFTGPSLSIEAVRHRLYMSREDCFDINQVTTADCEATLDREWEAWMDEIAGQYLRDLDAIPHHFQLHFLHAAEIVGYKHPDARIRAWWARLYVRLVEDMHLHPETEAEMDRRLGDNREQWLERADVATRA